MAIPLRYTFGNHMHWVDMEWLWGYHVLPGCIRDMLNLCREGGIKGCVNFDGIGYEKLAAEDPEALSELRDAIHSGMIEVVGGSYGQPYGLFHGAESNVRQRVYGARAIRRLFGVPVKTFWEEEFDFFPQLPQMLRGVGIEYGSLFFQWTWHTPEIPREDAPAVLWTAPDGSEIVCATRNKLNLHQWPEDMDATFASLSDGDAMETPQLIQQWLELMPSPDWMCRSELILPKLQELMIDSRFEITPVTLGEYLAEQSGDLPVRRYGMDQVWHGMTLGKNGDNMRRLSGTAERSLLTAETLAAVAGLFARPYAQWDVYPTWELEEAWRELLSAQHHDNDECEGLCGHVGRFSYHRSLSLSGHIRHRTMQLISQRVEAPGGSLVVFNPTGWVVGDTLFHPITGHPVVVRDIPPFGFKVVAPGEEEGKAHAWQLHAGGATGMLGGIRVDVDAFGRIAQIYSPEWPEGILEAPLLVVSGIVEGEQGGYDFEWMGIDPQSRDLVIRYTDIAGGSMEAWIKLVNETAAVDITLRFASTSRPGPGLTSSFQMPFSVRGWNRLITDQPYGFSEISATGEFLKKYPEGDWMTSPQWFETVHNPFTCLTCVDVIAEEKGLLVIHDGSQQWLRKDRVLSNVLTAYDPWDEDYFVRDYQVSYRLIPHRGLKNSERWMLAQTFLRGAECAVKAHDGGDIPASFSALQVNGAVATALYRETRDSAKGQPKHAADVLRRDYPYVLRMVEFDGEAVAAELKTEMTVEWKVRTNLLGEPEGGSDLHALQLRPYEIATLYLDIQEGQKVVRDLDAKREIWATVHRV